MNKTFRLNEVILLAAVCLFLTFTASAQTKETGKLDNWAKTEVTRNSEKYGLLVNVRSSRNKGFDRVVFEFKENVPTYQVKFARPPFYLGESDEKVKVTGKSFVEVTFRRASGYDFEADKPAITHKESTHKLPVVQETAFIYDFEGDVIFIVGLKQSKNFRVTELSNPARLVVDFKH